MALFGRGACDARGKEGRRIGHVQASSTTATVPQGPLANLDTLQYFDIAPSPEQVRTVEGLPHLGGSIGRNYYFSWYTHFIGYNLGLDVLFENPSFPEFITGVDVYRYAANSLNQVQTQGASLGFNYFLDDKFTLNGNYSWNKLVKTDEDDPIIPAFNTPEHKYNWG